MTPPAGVFSSANLDALVGHLPDGSLSNEIVVALRSATTETKAQDAIRAIVQGRIDTERASLDAETTGT